MFSNWPVGLIVFGLLFFLSATAMRWFIQCAHTRQWLDFPTDRSSHEIPTPRGGGAIFMGIWLILLGVLWTKRYLTDWEMAAIFPSTFGVCLLGYLEDRKGLSILVRFWGQILMMLLFLWVTWRYASCHTALGVAIKAWPVALKAVGLFIMGFSIVGSVNLYNFMDGMDGLAGMEALFLFGIGGGLFWSVGASGLAWLQWFLCALVLGFLVWNRPPARVFMGDIGSYGLGFLAALFAWIGVLFYSISVWVWLILYGLFWFDAAVTLFRRIYFKEPWTQPHKKHAFQRLHQAGYSHGAIFLNCFLLNLLLTVIALWAFYSPANRVAAFLCAVLLLTVAYGFVEWLNPMQRSETAKY